jgi:lipoprotein-releasing system permease protein
MRFELSVAFKYLLPRSRQLSVSIISLMSVLVISLVVWLCLVFLSVTHGIEKKWLEELVTINAPVRMIPTEEYYKSYYHLIDQFSDQSGYRTKTLSEKLTASISDPYDPSFDAELPSQFPTPLRNSDGTLKDLVKESWMALSSLKDYSGLRAQEYEVTFGNLELDLFRKEKGETSKSFLTQLSYISSFDRGNKKLDQLIAPPTTEDINNLLSRRAEYEGSKLSTLLSSFFEQLGEISLQTKEGGVMLPPALYPEKGEFEALGYVLGGKIHKVVLTDKKEPLAISGKVTFEDHQPKFSFDTETYSRVPLYLEEKASLQAHPIVSSISTSLSSLHFDVETDVQGVTIKGALPFKNLEVASANFAGGGSAPLLFYKSENIPSDHLLGTGILISSQFQKNGVLIGDTGMISYFAPSSGAMKEQRIPIYVAGFYDPGLMPVGGKVLFANPTLLASLRNEMRISDQMLGNGFQIHLNDIERADELKLSLQDELKRRGLDPYFTVESYSDYEFAKPVLEQLKSDKILFTLIAIIILVVACSNIISMLILLVNDKKKEIGILQSMGVSSRQITTIFGLCGFFTGLISSLLGLVAAFLTLHNLQSLVSFLSLIQGREAFQSAFYGTSGLPSEMSLSALFFILLATILISLLAGIVPALKASKIKPAVILRSE